MAAVLESDHHFGDHGPEDSCANPKHNAALVRRRQAKDWAWSPILRGRDGGGARDFLDGQPIHCGSALELQGMEVRGDDYGEYSALLPEGAIVRYELAWSPTPGQPQQRRIVLHASIAGHEFTSPHEQWMRFRWPRRDR